MAAIETMPMMKCGCRAQGTTSPDNNPVCVIHVGFTPDAEIVNENPPDISGRKARCSYYGSHCKSEANSDGSGSRWNSLPFFVSQPTEEYDQYYCGCWGWD